jgi:hypothetical protein
VSKGKNIKRRRHNNHGTSDTTELFALMKAENERRAKHDEHIEQSLSSVKIVLREVHRM